MPKVSVIVPCYNEQKTIRLLLEALYKQTYPRQDVEVIIADGLSTDATRQQVQAYQNAHPDFSIQIVDNPQRTIPAGLNRAIQAAKGEIIVRLDAHSMPYPDYISACVQTLEKGLGDNVGGVWEIRPGGESWQARGIATAGAHPLGVGDALYRYTSEARSVDTVPFGAFRRTSIDKIGLFDENLLTNEDYEFNVRLRQSGGAVWLDPSIRSIYFARQNYLELVQQYGRYGYWKARMLRRYPGTIRWRQALPPMFMLSLLAGILLSIWFSCVRWIFVIELSSYALVLLAVGIQQALAKRDASLMLSVPMAIALMHLSWGSAFLWSLVQR